MAYTHVKEGQRRWHWVRRCDGRKEVLGAKQETTLPEAPSGLNSSLLQRLMVRYAQGEPQATTSPIVEGMDEGSYLILTVEKDGNVLSQPLVMNNAVPS